MITDSFDINRIVQMVLTDLADRVEIVAPIVSQTSKIETVDDPEAVYIEARVLSLGELHSKLGSSKKLFISPKCILTPSARDELRKRKIEVAVRLPVSGAVRRSTCWLALHRPTNISTGTMDRIRKRAELVQESFDTLPDLVETAQRQLQANRFGVALTKQAATLLRLANQRETIRAVPGIDPRQAVEDASEIDANLLVIHPGRVGEYRIFEIVQQFTK